jgi:predicted lactoylglutathione lyase
MNVTDIKVFVPSKDYEISKAFYSDIGFKPEFVTDDLTLCQNGSSFLYLQRFYNQELADNFMLQICVSDIEEAFDVCSRSEHKTRIMPVQQEVWGKVFHLWGPAGELLHITEFSS